MPAFYKEWFYKAKRSLTATVITKPQPKALVFTGADSVKELCNTIAQFGASRVLIVTDKPLVELGVLDSTISALESHGVSATIYDGVLPDPTQKVVDDGLAVLAQSGCDAVLAFGGGSSIDAAKVIALAAANQCKAEDCLGLRQCKEPALPFFAVPTTAGTGSEATMIAVISDNETHEKNGVIDPALIPKATALDPVIMQGLPAHITAATGMDALTHAIEAYIGVWEVPETKYYCLSAIKLIFDNLPMACSDGSNLAAREAMAHASYYGGLAITNALVGYVHAVSHNLGAKYGVPHGLGNAMVLPHVLELMKDVAAPKFAEIARHVNLGNEGDSDAALTEALITHVKALNDTIGIPETTDVIKEADIKDLVDAALKEGSGYPTPRFLERAECETLIRSLMAA
ncbi:iron-containing alcohol dehydrogenase [Parahalioglobus pacificus]|uniref:Alcohol dehydrogenase n=1 Tax=Parahalioglobus pacificus TaxID=930806 RepID=A0A919CJN0_9GAMM|nr:iron-containing alcohol dehydrogenase [Halioglobus pacificus]GHD31438.1 alcohol dehydrogenase [Halioglobus pacificus]